MTSEPIEPLGLNGDLARFEEIMRDLLRYKRDLGRYYPWGGLRGAYGGLRGVTGTI